MIKFFTDKENALNDTSSIYENVFTGSIYYYNLEGEPIKVETFKDGTLISEFSPRLNYSSKIAPSKPGMDNPDDAYDEDTGSSGYKTVTVRHYTDWYKVFPNGTREYTHSVPGRTTYEKIYVSNNTAPIHVHSSP